MIEAAHRGEVPFHEDPLFPDYRYTVDNGGKCVQIVGYHDHGKPQSVSEVGYQRVEGRRGSSFSVFTVPMLMPLKTT